MLYAKMEINSNMCLMKNKDLRDSKYFHQKEMLHVLLDNYVGPDCTLDNTNMD